MKKVIFLLALALPLLCYAQNETNQIGVTFKYAYKSYVLIPQNEVFSIDDKGKEVTFANDDLSISLKPNKLGGAGFNDFTVTISNKTSKKITINIGESSYIADGNSIEVIDGNTLKINIDNAEKIWNIPPKAKATKALCQKATGFDVKQLALCKELSFYCSYQIDNEAKDLLCEFKIERASKKD